ncbi:kinase-like protein [Byssothecium circinans]|uniref:non-specific serine/threonine protein kinase n=1 Tax=Byssothecium circinans TaxID=147558 RepID=A0A6A5TRC8_9PLEO|nr:kinase-like protein [Byssothecium circinans]
MAEEMRRNSPASSVCYTALDDTNSSAPATTDAAPSSSTHGEATPTGKGRHDARSWLETDITPRSEMPSHPEALNERLNDVRADAEPSYFSPQPLRILNSLPTSHPANDPSPTGVNADAVHGTGVAGHISMSGEHADRPLFQRDLSSSSAASVVTARANSVDSYQAHTPPSKRQDGPYYPNQSYAALQSQQHHFAHGHHVFYPKSSHPTHHAGYSVSHIPTSGPEHYRDIMDTGSRTAGNSPANSPGLFKSDSPPLHHSKRSEDNLYSTPWLHPAHRQAPKETHRADVDVDPVSGRKIVNHYEIFDELGRGVHGKVKLGRNLETHANVAIKIVDRFSKRRRLGKNTSHEDKIKKEIAILKKARHPNIVSLLEVIDDPTIKKVYIVLEHVERGEVKWRIEGAKEVCQVEYRRYKRESKGIFENESEAMEDQRIMRVAQQKHERQKRRLAKLRRQRKQEFTENEPWSLELGGDSEDEYSDTDACSQSSTYGDNPSPCRPQHAHRESSTVGDSANMETAFRSSTPTATPVPTGLEGTMYGPYDTETFRGRTPSIAGSTSSHFTDGEEEVPEHFRYVPVLTMQQAREVLRDTVLGLEYLHYQNVIHRDIKPANLLQTAEKRIKISDFGVSYLGRRPADDLNGDQSESDFQDADDAVELAKTVGTPAFYAPELCITDLEAETPQIDHKIDIWALGVTLHCLIYGRVPFHDHNQWLLMKRIAEEDPYISRYRLKPVQPTSDSRPNSHGRTYQPMTASMRAPHDLEFEEIDEDLLDLFGKLFIKDPRRRITLEEIKRHRWLTRDLENFSSWFDETNPDKLSQGGKIKISKDDIEKAVVPITMLDRVKLGLRKVTEITRNLTRQGSRKRAPSTTSSNDALHGMSANSSSSTISQDGRRPSLGPGMPIYEALSRSREYEHPLSQSVTASPEPSELSRYFEGINSRTASPAQNTEGREHPAPLGPAARPHLHDRAYSALSSAASIRTVRQSDMSIRGRPVSPAIPPALPGTPTALDTPGGSNLGGIFGGMPKRAVNDARTEDKSLKLPRKQDTKYVTRAQSIDRLIGADDDAHTGPSLAISTDIASGHVDQPDLLKEMSPTLARIPSSNFSSDARSPNPNERASSRQSSISSVSSRLHRSWAQNHDLETGPTLALPAMSSSPGARDTSNERFNRAKDEFVRRRIREENLDRERPRSGSYQRPCSALSQTACPPSPDDELFFQRQKVEDFLNRQHQPMHGTSPISYPVMASALPRTITSSSSEDLLASMSQSTSNPSIPSIASASSSVVPDDCMRMDSFPSMTPAASAESFVNQFDAPTEDPAGYDGDHAVESEEDESSEDELIISVGKNRKRGESISNAELARSNLRDGINIRRRSVRSGSNGTVKKVPPPGTDNSTDTPLDLVSS